MKKNRRSIEQIIRILREGDSGQSVEGLCRANNISMQSYYRWKIKYGSMDWSEVQRLRDLEKENTTASFSSLGSRTPSEYAEL